MRGCRYKTRIMLSKPCGGVGQRYETLTWKKRAPCGSADPFQPCGHCRSTKPKPGLRSLSRRSTSSDQPRYPDRTCRSSRDRQWSARRTRFQSQATNLPRNILETMTEGLERWYGGQRRYYDFNVRIEEKRVEKLRYMHRNPVERELVSAPEVGNGIVSTRTPASRNTSCA